MSQNCIKIDSPIIPGVGLGGIQLCTHIKEYYELINSFKWVQPGIHNDCSATLFSSFHIRYELEDTVYMFFNILNGKLYKLTALKKYKGCLFGKIKVGMKIDEVLKMEQGFVFNEDEELYYLKGVTLETDAYNQRVEAITVHVEEMDTLSRISDEWLEFEKGNW